MPAELTMLTPPPPLPTFPLSAAASHVGSVVPSGKDPLGIQGRLVNPTGSGIPSAQVWAGPLEGGAVAVALFNAGEAGANISATAEMLGMPPGALVRVRDLLAREDVGVVPAGYSALVGPHDIHFVRMEPVP